MAIKKALVLNPQTGNLQQLQSGDVLFGLEVGVDVQAYDAGLSALAAKTSLGILVQTGDDTYASRTIAVPAAGITITNANGVDGNPTLALANDLAAVEGLTTNGFAVRNSDGVWTTQSITTASTERVTVTNGDGLAGSPTLDLAQVVNGATGTFQKVTVDAYGRVSGTTPVTTADVTALVDAAYVNVTGDTMSGSLTFSSGTVTGLAAPVNATDAATKAYVDNLTSGLSWQEPVKAIVATVPTTGMVAGERYLATDTNQIYTATSATATTAVTPADGYAIFNKTDESGWVFSGTAWVQFSGAGQIDAGIGMSKVGNVLTVNMGAGIANLPSDEVGIDLFSATGALILTTDGSTNSTDTASKLALRLKAAGGLTQDVDGLYIPASAVTNAMLQHSTLTVFGDATSFVPALGDSIHIIGNNVQGISTAFDAGNNLVITAADATSTQKGVASFSASHFAITAGAVSLAATLGDLLNVDVGTDVAETGTVLVKTASGFGAVSAASILNTLSIDALADVTITTATTGNVLYFNGTAWVNGARGSVSGVQAYSTELDGVSALAATGLVARNGAGAYSTVSLVAGTGVTLSGTYNTTVGLTATGVTAGTYNGLVINAQGQVTAAVATTVTGTAGQIAVADASSAAPILSLVAAGTAGTYDRVTTDAFGRVTAGSNVTITGTENQIAVTGAAGATPTIALAPSGVTAGTYNGVTVDEFGRVTGATSITIENSANTLAVDTTAAAVADAVYFSAAGVVSKANASAAATVSVVGFVSKAGEIVTSGVVNGFTALVPGARYFLSEVDGLISTTPAATGYVLFVGIASTATQLVIQVGNPIEL